MTTFEKVKNVDIAVRNLTLTVETQSIPFVSPLQSKKVVQDVNFDVPRGQLMAIMGGSGSGKTTVLNALAGRSRLKQQGQILLNNISINEWKKSSDVAYVQQHDHLLPYLTVRETLLYAAQLRLPSSFSSSRKKDLVEEIILELGLKEVADTLIGDEWRKGLSGGEKRRVSVGVQLLVNPSVVFLDEPTTGLDAFTSLALIETLKRLCQEKGLTMCVSIHQPSTNVFELFDHVVILTRGRVAYAGAVQNGVPYFNGLGYSIPVQQNPADWLIDITSIDNRSSDAEMTSSAQVQSIIEAWKSLPSGPIEVKENQEIPCQNQGASFLTQVTVLTRRATRHLLQDRLMTLGSLLEVVIVTAVVGYIFFRLEETQAGFISRKAVLYLTSALQPYLQLMFFIYKFSMDMKVFDRERQDNMYSVVAYLVSWFVANIPLQAFLCFLFSLIFYSMTGLRGNSPADALYHFGIFYAVVFVEQLVTIAFSFASIAVFRDFANGSMLANIIFTFFSMSAGFFVPPTIIPVWIGWFKEISYLTFAYRILMTNEFQDRYFSCPDIPLPPGVTQIPLCQGNNILISSGLELNDIPLPFIKMAIEFVVFMALATLLLIVWVHPDVKVADNIKVKNSQVAPGVSAQELPLPGTEQVSVPVTLSGVDVVLKNVCVYLEKTKKWAHPLKKQSKIPTSQVTKTILDNVSVTFPQGKLSVILGSSGSGKSTLLNILTARSFASLTSNARIRIRGSVLLNHSKATPQQIRSMCSFVRQDDSHLLPALTARETLHYAARLTLPLSMSKKEKIRRAEQVLMVLGLKDCANTVVGGEGVKGLSGGEKRRLSIGVQMLTQPNVLVIDEPTSGLDASTALRVMEKLKEIADSGQTVICSIHQPRSDIFKLFDNVVLLVRGGRVCFSGPSQHMATFFTRIHYPPPALSNPSEHALDISSIDLRNQQAETTSRVRVDKIVAAWHQLGAEYEPEHSMAPSSSEAQEEVEFTLVSQKTLAPVLYVLPILTSRSFTNLRRQFSLMIARIWQTLSLGVILVIFYARLKFDQTYIQARVGALQQIASVMFVGMLNSIAVFPPEYALFKFERLDNTYDASAFFLAYSINEIPFELISSFLFAVVLYGASGLQFTFQSVAMAFAAVFCISNIGESMGVSFCVFVEHVGFSVQVMSALLSIITMLSGFLSVQSTPVVLDRLNYLSPIRYAARIVGVNEFSGLTFDCTREQIDAGLCVYKTGEQVLDLYGFAKSDLWLNFGILVGLTVVYRITALLIIKYKKH